MLDAPAVYVERYRWAPTIAIGVAGDPAFLAVVVFVPMRLLIRILLIAFFGWAAAFSFAVALSHKVALRVDHTGVTFGGGPFRYITTSRFHPWDDIQAISLWQRCIPVTIGRWTPFALGPIRYIGLRRRAGTLPISPARRSRADRPASWHPFPASRLARPGTCVHARRRPSCQHSGSVCHGRLN